MKRALALLVIGLLGVLAWTAPSPPPPEAVAPMTTTTVPELETAAGFSSCPWAVASDDEETYFGLVTLPPNAVLLSFPLSGDVRATVEEALPGPGATSVRLGQSLAQGLAPATIEFSNAPAASNALVTGPARLAGTICPSSTPKVWHLPGGSTEAGNQLILQLYNPFSEDANVTVTAYSDLGPEPAPELEALRVSARSWRSFDLHNEFPAREMLGMVVEASQGNVVPALIMDVEAAGEAIWPGLGQAEIWELPVVRIGGLQSEVIVANDGTDPVTYEVDLISEEGTEFAVATRSVDPLTQDRVPLVDLAEGTFGVRVRADGPVAVLARARGQKGFAVVPGAAVAAPQWLLPGFGTHPDASYQAWIINPDASSLTVTLSTVSASGPGAAPDKVAVPAEAIRSVTVDRLQMFGLLAEAPGPFSIAWSAELPDGGVAFVEAVPVLTRSPAGSQP
ncbi:MAG: DUF5719 family protein [Acidimicrobiia bacterium]